MSEELANVTVVVAADLYWNVTSSMLLLVNLEKYMYLFSTLSTLYVK